METAKKVFSALFGGIRFTVSGIAKTLLSTGIAAKDRQALLTLLEDLNS